MTASHLPRAVSVVTLFVDDLEEAKAFYLKVFEATVAFEDEESVAFRFDNVLLNLLIEGAAPEVVDPVPVASKATGVRMLLTVSVDDVDARCEQLAGTGVEILSGPIDRPWGARTATFSDPAGHVWELAQQIAE